MLDGLYSIHADLLDGLEGRGSGVLLLRDGRIHGGDAMLYYVGSYAVRDGVVKGEVLVRLHTRIPGVTPLFGGVETSIGFSGKIEGDSATLSGSAVVGKSAQLFKATLRKLAD
jgi:hypothetical protein